MRPSDCRKTCHPDEAKRMEVAAGAAYSEQPPVGRLLASRRASHRNSEHFCHDLSLFIPEVRRFLDSTLFRSE